MYSEASMKSARLWMWFLGSLTAILLGLWVASCVTMINGHISILTLLGLALAVPIAPLVSFASYAWFKVRSGQRIAAVAEAHPGAYLVQIVLSTPTVKQARLVAAALDLDDITLRRNSYGTFAATESALLIYGGGANPRLRMKIPTSSLAYAQPGFYSNGVRTVPAIDLGFLPVDRPASDAPVPLQLVPLIQPSLFPKPMIAEYIPAELARMQASTHPRLAV